MGSDPFILPWPRGFVLFTDCAEPVRVHLRSVGDGSSLGPTFFEVRRSASAGEKRLVCERVALPDFVGLMRSIRRACRHDSLERQRRRPGSRVQPFSCEARTLLYGQYKELLRTADCRVLAVQKAVFSSTLGGAEVTFHPELYLRKHLVSDLLRFPAVRIAASRIGEVVRDRLLQQSVSRLVNSGAERTAVGLLPVGEFLEGRAASIHPRRLATVRIEESLSLLDDWMDLFSPDGRSYRSLRRTLMNLPGGLSPRLVWKLCDLRLPRPLFHSAEIHFLSQIRGGNEHPNWAVFAKATPELIARALDLVSQYVRTPLTAKKARDLGILASVVCDYPEIHRGGNLVGVTKRAIRWHRDMLPVWEQEAVRRLGPPETPVSHPKVPLPVESKVRFLGTLGDVAREGLYMQHCLGQYAPRAARGESFFFHVEYRNSEATIEVGSKGEVRQAFGPGNRVNAACRWGTHVLSRWGKTLMN